MSRVRSRIKKVVPRRVVEGRTRFRRVRSSLSAMLPAYYTDFRRYLRYSSSNGPYQTRDNLRAKITATYHNLEKGLSLPEPRPGFGTQPVGTLVLLLSAYVEAFGYDDWLGTPSAVLRAYRDFCRESGTATVNDDAIAAYLVEAEAHLGTGAVAGTRTLTRDEVERAVADVSLDFFTTRSSVRQYARGPVDPADLEFAARAAQKAPAVCNRQFGQVHVFQDPHTVRELLELQGGSRGFGDELAGVAIITTDLRSFWAAGERTQAWTDGGMFAMSFVLGLHARGLGAVCLNWSKTPDQDARLRAVAGLPEESVVIMLVGFGPLREAFQVAASPRVPLEETLHLR